MASIRTPGCYGTWEGRLRRGQLLLSLRLASPRSAGIAEALGSCVIRSSAKKRAACGKVTLFTRR